MAAFQSLAARPQSAVILRSANGIRTRTTFIQAFRALGLGLDVVHVCVRRFHEVKANVTFVESPSITADIVITDGWPKSVDTSHPSLTRQHVTDMGNPKLLPIPPFLIGRELFFDPLTYDGFVGYEQKTCLATVQAATHPTR
ncbi:hypothetical protein OKW40_004362 [Paraburkholderia sp. RAU6.4a]|uniref:hypothetical protein n=1 Tax=Paraburkholderia sp. RAU6.4a TaxID=2991067 RepID=UPI003D263CE4